MNRSCGNGGRDAANVKFRRNADTFFEFHGKMQRIGISACKSDFGYVSVFLRRSFSAIERCKFSRYCFGMMSNLALKSLKSYERLMPESSAIFWILQLGFLELADVFVKIFCCDDTFLWWHRKSFVLKNLKHCGGER